MNATLSPACFRAFGASCLLAAGAFGATGSDAMAASAAPASSAPKTHTLFMGAEISLERDKQVFPVKDVDGSAFVIDRHGQTERVPMNRGAAAMRVDLALKLTERSADISNLKAERAYTPAKDPYRKFLRQNPGGAGDAQAALAFGAVNQALISQAAAGVAASNGSYGGAGAYETARGQAGSALDQYGAAQLAASSDRNSPAYFAGKLQEDLAKEEFDAIAVSFQVSAPRPLARPYVVLTATFRAKDERTEMQRNWIYAQALPPIEAKPQKVTVLQGGFPLGYVLENYQIHLYDRGTEVATNVAPKRVPLTRDEALQYVVMEYVSSHKRATAPAKPAMGRLPADLPDRLARGQFGDPIFVKVTPEGVPGGAFLDAACTRPVDDAYLSGLVQGLRFTPALDHGKPVEGVARVKLRDLNLSI